MGQDSVFGEDNRQPNAVFARTLIAGNEELEALTIAITELNGATPCTASAENAEQDEWFSDYMEDQIFAASICKSECSVINLCGIYALAANEKNGVWGGMTEFERSERSAVPKQDRLRKTKLGSVPKTNARRGPTNYRTLEVVLRPVRSNVSANPKDEAA